MPDLLIRFAHGQRFVSKDYRGASRLECVLHDATRERRVALNPAEANLGLRVLEYLYDHKLLEGMQ